MAKRKIKIDIKADELRKKLNIKDGYSPIKGVDYFDGEKGDRGEPGVTPDTTEVALEASKLAQVELESRIPTITQIAEQIPSHGDKVRDSLELLQDEDRLDKSAIRGLDDYEEISKLARQPKKTIHKNYVSSGTALQNLQQVTDNGATTTNTITAQSFITTGGASTDFVKGDGSLDSTTYLDTITAASTYVPYTGANANVDLGVFEFTTAQVNTPIIKNPSGNTLTIKNFLNSTLAIIDSNGNTFAGVMYAPVGTAALPSYSFTGDPNTGIYNIGADILGISTNGLERARFLNTGTLLTTPSFASGGVVTLGLVANSWTNSTLVNKLFNATVTVNQSGTAGFDFIDVAFTQTSVGSGEKNLIRFSRTGTDVFKVDYTGVMTLPLGSNSLPTHSFVGDTDTGMYSAGANIISFAVGGTNSFTLQSDFSGKFASSNPTLYLESSAANAANAGTIIMRTPGGSESFTQKFDASANIFSMLYGTTTAITITGTNVTSSLAHLFASGSASLPGLSFTGDTNTGMYRVGSDTIGFSAGGTERMRIGTTLVSSNNIPFEAITFRVLNTTDVILTYLKTGGAGSNSGGVYADGHLDLQTTGSGNYADINILAGETISSQIGGNISLTAGLTEAGGIDGGYVDITGGYSYGNDGGHISLIGGGSVANNGGYVQIFGGDTSAGGSTSGGNIDMRGGYNSNTTMYAPVYIQANGGNTNIGASAFTVDTYDGWISSNIIHKFNSSIQTPSGMPTSDPMDGQGTLWYDTTTNIVYRGT